MAAGAEARIILLKLTIFLRALAAEWAGISIFLVGAMISVAATHRFKTEVDAAIDPALMDSDIPQHAGVHAAMSANEVEPRYS